MTVAAFGAVGAAQGIKNALPKSATLGALVLLAGGALVYWALYMSRDGRGLFGLGKDAQDAAPAFLGGLDASQGMKKIGRTLDKGTGGQGAVAGSDLADLLSNVGFRGDALRTALAVARGESGWRTGAVGDEGLQTDYWGPSIGLFQIRCVKAQTGTGQLRDCAALRDPTFNAKAAYAISQGGRNWQAWTAYTSGAWRKFLADAEGALRGAVA